MLTTAVSGEVFACPTVGAFLAAIIAVSVRSRWLATLLRVLACQPAALAEVTGRSDICIDGKLRELPANVTSA